MSPETPTVEMHPQRWGDPAAATALPESARGLVDLAFGLQDCPAPAAASSHPQGRDAAMTQTSSPLTSFVGIDVSKDHLDVHIRPEGTHTRLPNTEEGCDQLLAQLRHTGLFDKLIYLIHPIARVLLLPRFEGQLNC